MSLAARTMLILCLATPSIRTAAAQGAHAVDVDGRVRLAGGEGSLDVVRVKLQRLGETVQEEFTRDGRFEFEAVSPGPYTVSVEAPGFDNVSRYIEVPGDHDLLIELGRSRPSVPAAGSTVSVHDYQIPRAARQLFDDASKKIKTGDCKTAIDLLSQAVRIFAEYAEAHNTMGDCYTRTNQLDLAEQAYREALPFTSTIDPAINLANVYLKEGRPSAAADVLTQALNDRLEHTADAHLLLAKAYLAEGRSEGIPRELELYLREAESGPLRDRIEGMLKEARTASSGH